MPVEFNGRDFNEWEIGYRVGIYKHALFDMWS